VSPYYSADGDLDLAFHFYGDSDPTIHVDADPDPTFHFDLDPGQPVIKYRPLMARSNVILHAFRV
jgi:hypothetical protein